MKQPTQRIKLRCQGSPVKFDGTVLETTPDGRKIKVRFDGPMEDKTFYAAGDTRMASDMKNRDGRTVDDYGLAHTYLMWEVL